jgi:hypothetical protein
MEIILARDNLKDKRIYKFRSIPKDSSDPTKQDPKKLHYIERIFTHNELYFPSPLELNDPLECRPLFVVGDLSDEEYKKKYVSHTTKIMIAGGNTGNPNKIKIWLERLTQEEANNFTKPQTDFHRRKLQTYGICSFCAKPDNPIVWSHYADQHRGFSLIFNADNDLFGGALKVKYQDQYPSIDVTEENDGEILRNSVLVKFSDWSYEEEFRLVSESEPNFEYALPVINKIMKFPSDMLIGVIYGCKISDSDRLLLENLCNNYSTKLYKKQAVLNDDRFLMKIIDI